VAVTKNRGQLKITLVSKILAKKDGIKVFLLQAFHQRLTRTLFFQNELYGFFVYVIMVKNCYCPNFENEKPLHRFVLYRETVTLKKDS